MKVYGMEKRFVDMIPENMDICLLGLQGSRALGFAETKDADWDYRGVFVSPNKELLSFNKPKTTIEINSGAEDNDAEFVFHEIEKFLSLAIVGNPSVINLLFLPKYNIKNDIGDTIVKNRNLFLGEDAIRKAFGGYAYAQILYLKRNLKFPGAKKLAKHVKHCFRLFDNGQELLETGKITIPLKDPQKYIDISKITDIDKLYKMFDERDKEFQNCKSILPKEPDKYWVEKLLLKIRGF